MFTPRRLKQFGIAGALLLLPLLLFSAQAPLSPFGALQTIPDKSMVVFPVANQTNQITLTPAGEAYQTAGTTFPESAVVSAWKEIGTLALTDPPLAAILTKYNVQITAADGTPVFPDSPMAIAFDSFLDLGNNG